MVINKNKLTVLLGFGKYGGRKARNLIQKHSFLLPLEEFRLIEIKLYFLIDFDGY